MESIMSKDCSVILNFYSDEYLVAEMKNIKFVNIEVKNVYLKDRALEAYGLDDLNIIIDSKIFILIKASKS